MEEVRIRARFDWLVELGGAMALGLAAGFAAYKLAPFLGFVSAMAMIAIGFACSGLGLLAMRAVKPETREQQLAGFVIEPIEPGQLEPLLLDTLYEEPLLLEEIAEDEPLLLEEIADDGPLLLEEIADDGPLLLDDPLAGPEPDSRVVQLFAGAPMPTPGQLKERIDRHLATGTMHVVHEHEGPAPDASDALYAALAELRSSLR